MYSLCFIKLLESSYELQAVTLWNLSHYTCKLKVDDNWMFYDGLVPGLQTMSREEIPAGYRPTYCLFGK